MISDALVSLERALAAAIHSKDWPNVCELAQCRNLLLELLDSDHFVDNVHEGPHEVPHSTHTAAEALSRQQNRGPGGRFEEGHTHGE